jgi:hypothetical protein
MTFPALLPLLVAAAPAPALDCAGLSARAYPDARSAFQAATAGSPLVIGIGEYHPVEGRGPRVDSALRRFTRLLLPSLERRAGHLVAETWIKAGRCGEVEKRAVARIEEESRRPAKTEDEVTSMLRRAADLGIEPHILKVDCDDYADVLDASGEIDDVKLLTLVARLLQEKALDLVERERGTGRAVVLYGGALHNELQPSEDLAPFSFGPALSRALEGRYRQVTLLVPEIVEADPTAREEAFFDCMERHASRDRVLLMERGEAARYLVFARAAKPAPKRR